jgi:hypothetical protein
MEVILGQFVKALAASGLISAGEIEAFVRGLPPEKKPEDGAALARQSREERADASEKA